MKFHASHVFGCLVCASACAAPSWDLTSADRLYAKAGDKVELWALPRVADNDLPSAGPQHISGSRNILKYNGKDLTIYVSSDKSSFGQANGAAFLPGAVVDNNTGAAAASRCGQGMARDGAAAFLLVSVVDRPADLISGAPPGLRLPYIEVLVPTPPTAYGQAVPATVREYASDTAYTAYSGTWSDERVLGQSSINTDEVFPGLNPARVDFYWEKNGSRFEYPAGATITYNPRAILVIPSFNPAQDPGEYKATFRNRSTGETITWTTTLADVASAHAEIVNASIRATVGSGNETFIVGLVLVGGDTKRMLIRGVGPGISQYLSTYARDPNLTLFSRSNVIAENDDWGSGTNASEIQSEVVRLGAGPLAVGSHDATLLCDLSGGAYTCHVNAANADTGVALVELYDAGGGPRIFNFSCRKFVGTGDNVLIAGFVVSGNRPKRLLIRAVGPTLAGQGVTNLLADPILEVHRNRAGTDTVVATNDDWSGLATIVDAASSVGAFTLPANSKDSCVLIGLDAGVYSAVVKGVNSTTGVAMVEVYTLD